jgi:hypothetical protein
LLERRFFTSWRERERGTEGERDRGTEGERERDRGTEGQRERGREGEKERGTEGQRDRGTEGESPTMTQFLQLCLQLLDVSKPPKIAHPGDQPFHIGGFLGGTIYIQATQGDIERT